jgi:ribosomal protein S20
MSRVKTSWKKVDEAVATGDITSARLALRDAESETMRAVSKGVIPRNTGSRKVSRLTQRVKHLEIGISGQVIDLATRRNPHGVVYTSSNESRHSPNGLGEAEMTRNEVGYPPSDLPVFSVPRSEVALIISQGNPELSPEQIEIVLDELLLSARKVVEKERLEPLAE